MDMIIWQDNYSVGNSLLDQQHKALIDKINILFEKSGDYFFVGQTIQTMVEYACYHFIDEEKYLTENAYPDLKSQKAHQKLFMEKVHYYSTRFQTDIKHFDTMEMLNFLSEWCVNHIVVENGKFKEYFQNKSLQPVSNN